ncbi:MAG: DNA-binding response regulator [Armatimonadetes bacterium CG_4_10_14_3_um_filter_66_18]|nr:MAG: DNA-binding response regulator [Armatimonadetes bacterium CG06_land_8_20_14_3_00_66_21]PIY52948.1 MAG: DNA-binding response regulator [Armatimonadetes bacterium CG_4_10_14_3_um_filter_66_18]PJB74580.1 MAG: DNA-binding response regulator [Armatimonadetes bacterium CG_4_9_14_3_um_filter_66_14]
MAKIRVAIVDDETVIRQAMTQLLDMEEDLEVVGGGKNGEEAIDLVHEHLLDVLLTDLNMPVMDGLTAIRAIKQEYPNVEICVLTVHADDEHLFEALKAGAKGYLLKDATPDEVVEAVRTVAHGGAVLYAPLATRVLAEFQRLTQQKDDLQRLFSQLTRRELECLGLLADGKTNRQIADELFLSLKTVKTHVGNILRKLEVNSRTEAAILAVQSGLGA